MSQRLRLVALALAALVFAPRRAGAHVWAVSPVTPAADSPAPALAVDPDDEYQLLLSKLPQDFDVNYRFDGPAETHDRRNHPASKRSTRAMTEARRSAFLSAGGVTMALGLLGMSVGGGLLSRKDPGIHTVGKATLGAGGVIAAVGLALLVTPPIAAGRKTARTVAGGPMWVRQGGGFGINGRF